MRLNSCNVLALVVVTPLIAFQPTGTPWRETALARPGIHHAQIKGRFVTTDGHPIGSVTVQLASGSFRDLPVAQTESSTDGRFQFRDVNTSSSPGIRWYPPEGWLNGAAAVAGESGDAIDVGEIRLEVDTVIRLAVEVVGGQPLVGKGVRDPSVILEGVPNGPRIAAEKSGELWVLRQIPFQEARWNISIWNGDHSETFPGTFHVDRGRRDQLFLLRLRRDTVKRISDWRHEGTLEISQVLVPDPPASPNRHAQAKILFPDGTPIQGALAHISDFLGRSSPVWALTDANGTFDIRYSGMECQVPGVLLGSAESRLPFPESDRSNLCEMLSRGGNTLTMPATTRLILKPMGNATLSSIRAFWWHSSFGWLQWPSLEPWVSLRSWDNKFLVKLEAPGFVPLAQVVEGPNVKKEEKAPDRLEATFTFDGAVTRELIAQTDGRPLAGAIIDLELIRDLTTHQRTALASYSTGPDGRFQLNGAESQLIEAFIYAQGFEPQRVIWEPGTLLRVNLIPRQASLSFSGLRPGNIARIRPVDSPDSVRTLSCDFGKPTEVRVAAGPYDIVVYGDAGQVLSYRRISAIAGQTQIVDIAIDQRPRLIVRYPEEGWTAAVSDSTPGGMATGWSIYSTIGGSFAISDTAAVLERETAQESVFRVSRAGKIHLQISRAGQAHMWWREIVTGPGETITVEVPKGEANLQGAMRSYDGGAGFSHHGWAGPRMQLISDDPTKWSVTVFIPPRDGPHTFTLKGLPVGDYHLYQHLIGTPKTYKGANGKEETYTLPLDAWGGIGVKLASGETTKLNDFVDYAFGQLQVFVQDQRGQLLDGAVLRIRDRMSEAWRQVAEGPTTLSNAAHPIPYPTATRLQQGHATLPSVRAGWLELTVELDDGSVYPLTVRVDPNSPLRLKLPGLVGSR